MRHARQTLSTLNTKAPFSASSALTDLLLSAALHKYIRTPHSTPKLEFTSLPSQIPDSAILRLFRLSSLSIESKISLFNLLSSIPSFSFSSSSLSALLLSLSCAGRLSDLPNLLHFALSSSAVDATTFSFVISAFIRAERYDLVISAIDDAVSLFDQVLSPRTYCIIMLALLKKSQLHLALPMFQKLMAFSAQLDPQACNQLLVALRKAGMQVNFRNVFDELYKRGFPFDTWGYNICIHSFGEWKDLGTALKLFKEMKGKGLEPDLCSYNTVVGALCNGGKVADALSVYEEITKKSGHEPDCFTYQNLILGCCKCYRVDEAVRVFREMEFNGIKADTLAYNTLIDGLMKVRKLAEACQLFEKMVADGVRASCYTHNIMIDGLFRNDRPAAAFALFTELKKRGQIVDGISYSIIISRLCKEVRVSEALELVKEMEERGFTVDLVTITSLLIGLHKNGRWDSAEKLVKHVRDTVLLPSVLRWKENIENSLKGPQDKGKDFTPIFPAIGNLSDVMGLMDSADCGFREADSSTSYEDEWSSSPYLDKIAKNSKAFVGSQFLTVQRGRRIQVNGFKSFDTDMMNTYLSIFLSNGKLSMACKLFEIFTSLGSEPVGYTYNSLLSSLVKKGYLKDAWGIIQDMMSKKCPADVATFNLIIQGLSKLGKGDLAANILDWLLKNGGYLDIVLYNTMIHALGKAGQVDEANKLFKKMAETGISPDVVTFNTLIEVNSKAGRVKEAYKFLRKMLASGCMPNHVTDTILDFLEKEIEKERLHKASIRRNDDFHPDNIC